MPESPHLDVSDTPSVFNHRNNPALPDDTCGDLTLNGIGVVDWGTGLSWDYELAKKDHQKAAKNSLERVLGLNRHGGYGVIHTEGFEEVVIGRVEPPCIRFLELSDTSGEKRFFKAFEMAEFSQVNIRDEYSDLHSLLTNRAPFETHQDVSAESAKVTEAFIDLDLKGKLESRD